MTTTRRASAFTLIELLIVVGIMALLMSILLPSLSRVRYQARSTKCLAQLHDIYLSTQMYIHDYARLPPLNNDANEGAWQYNYLIYDGRDFDQCFGPLGQPTGPVRYTVELYCPLQKNEFHRFQTPNNPWPPVPNADVRAGFARRHGMTGRSFSDFRHTLAFMSDLMHEPALVRSGHGNGVNVCYTDGHARWVKDPGILTDNNLASPFDPLDNPIVENIWNMLDRGGR